MLERLFHVSALLVEAPMKEVFLLTSVLLAVTGALPAEARPGLNLGWGPYCPTRPQSVPGWSDPCDGSGSIAMLTASFRSPINLPNVVGEAITLDVEENSSVLSDYWHVEDENPPGQMNPAGCRGTAYTGPYAGNHGSLVVSVSDPSFGAAPGDFTGCTKLWGTAPSGSVYYLPGDFSPNRARLHGFFAKSPGSPVTANVQYGAFVATIDTNHQIDDPSNPPNYVCAGCQDNVCIVFSEITLRQSPGSAGGDLTVSQQDVRQLVSWLGAFGMWCTPTPTHRSTWGQVKSMYR